MHHFHCRISNGLWKALERHGETTGESASHVVSMALAQYLGVQQHTIFQVSTSTALVEGVYQGAVRIGTLRAHGDLGLGTFEHLDGEMVVVDGHFFQVKSDGSVHEVDDDVLSPFAVVTRFSPDQSRELPACPQLAALVQAFDGLRDSNNVFFALRVDGHFDSVHVRSMCRTEEGVPLAQAAATQPEFELANVSGTLVGFWCPEYSKALSVPGYHFHFLSSDHRAGGHVLECAGKHLTLQLQREGQLAVALPETEDFLKADLTRDPSADLGYAENAHSKPL